MNDNSSKLSNLEKIQKIFKEAGNDVEIGLLKGIEAKFTLYNDDSVREKLTVMSKCDAMMDDARNPDIEDLIEELLELGKTYKISITEIKPDE